MTDTDTTGHEGKNWRNDPLENTPPIRRAFPPSQSQTFRASVEERATRTRAQWSNMRPDAVVAGSQAQVLYCIQDARSDIILLWAEIDQLRWQLDNKP